MTVATTAPERAPIEPLFASNARLWLRVWVTTQAVAIGVTTYVALDRAGGLRALLAAPSAARAVLVFVLLIAYHAIGLRAHGWILRHPWAVLLFMPLGWALVLSALELSAASGLLVLGAIIQGFIFLPFAWAVAILASVAAALMASIVARDHRHWTSVVVASLVGVAATSTMIGTVMLYIHRVNRDAAIRARLLRELDDAQRDLAERAREAGVQAERHRLAQEMHDTLAQGFTSVIRHLEAIELSFDGSGTSAAMQGALPHLAHAQAVSRASLAEIRRVIWALRPTPLTDAPLVSAIERTVRQWGEANGVATTCAIDVLPALHPDADVTLLRATQESLSNVARHAGATRVAVTMQCVGGLVLLSVEDDGRGFAAPEAPGDDTLGIAGMRERVRRFGGHLLIESAPGSGASITVALPLAAIAAPHA